MAKRRVTAVAEEPGNGPALSAALRRQLEALRRPVVQAAQRFGVIRESLRDLAPQVIRLYNAITAENERFSFVEFARLFDHTIPTHAADKDGVIGYRNHKVYYTLQYMRRLVTLRPRGRQGVRDSATDGLARTLATILQIVADPAPVWAAVQQEFRFSERLINNLRKRVENTKPLFALEIRRPVAVGNVIHMPPITREAQGERPGVAGADVAAAMAAEAPRRRRGRPPRQVAA